MQEGIITRMSVSKIQIGTKFLIQESFKASSTFRE